MEIKKIIENGITLIGGTTGFNKKGELYTRDILFDEKTNKRYYAKKWQKNLYLTKTMEQLSKSAERYYDINKGNLQ